jgi:hypothetical protein
MRQAGRGAVRLGSVGLGKVWLARLVSVGHGAARHGQVRQAGRGGLVAASLGSARPAWLGREWLVKARHGLAGKARRGKSRPGPAWHGVSWQAS